MRKFFDPDVLARTYRDPLAIADLAVDLLPIVAVMALGWGPVPLVALYWLENVLLGGFTIARMVSTTVAGVGNVFAALFMVPFFCFHYGMFTMVHGMFVRGFATMRADGSTEAGVSDGPGDLIIWALGSGAGMIWFLFAIGLVMAAYFARDFILRGQYKTSSPSAEMFQPYGRVMTLHVALLLGALLTMGTGRPLLGVTLLIFLRVVFGVIFSVRRHLQLTAPVAPPVAPPVHKVDAG